MASIFAQLNLKDQPEILIVNAPESFEPEVAALANVAVQRDPAKVKSVRFALAFVSKQTELDADWSAPRFKRLQYVKPSARSA